MFKRCPICDAVFTSKGETCKKCSIEIFKAKRKVNNAEKHEQEMHNEILYMRTDVADSFSIEAEIQEEL